MKIKIITLNVETEDDDTQVEDSELKELEKLEELDKQDMNN